MSLRLSDKERELLRREVYLVDLRRRDTEHKLHGMEERARRIAENEALRKFGRVKREREEDEEGADKKPKVASLVALPGGATADTEEAPTDAVEVKDEKDIVKVERPKRLLKIADTKRDRKLMGFLVGHLNKSKEENSTTKDEKGAAFQLKMKRVEDRIQATRQEEVAQDSRQLEAEKSKQTELVAKLTKRQEQLQKAYSRAVFEERDVFFAHFLETTASPKLYFLPSHHNTDTRKRVEARKAGALAKYQDFRKSLDLLIADIETNSIEMLLPFRGQAKGRGAGKGERMQRFDPIGVRPIGAGRGPRKAERAERSQEEVEEMRERLATHDANGNAEMGATDKSNDEVDFDELLRGGGQHEDNENGAEPTEEREHNHHGHDDDVCSDNGEAAEQSQDADENNEA